MALTPEQQERALRIAEIQNVLRSGATSVSVDGETVTFDVASLRRELRQLQALDDPDKRPTVFMIDFGLE